MYSHLALLLALCLSSGSFAYASADIQQYGGTSELKTEKEALDNINFEMLYDTILSKDHSRYSTFFGADAFRPLLIKLERAWPEGLKEYGILTKEKLIQLIDEGSFSCDKCNYEYYNSHYKGYDRSDFFGNLNRYLEESKIWQVTHCIRCFARELEKSINSSTLPDKLTAAESVKKVFLLVGGSDTWPVISNGQTEVTHQLAIKNLMNYFVNQSQLKLNLDVKHVDALQDFFKNLTDRVVIGIEPQVVALLNNIRGGYYMLSDTDFKRTAAIFDLIKALEFCKNLFISKVVHYAPMALCLLNKYTKSVEEAKEHMQVAKTLGKELPDYFKDSWGYLYEKYLDDSIKIKRWFFQIQPAKSKDFEREDTLWFLKRLRDFYLIEGLNTTIKDKHLRPNLEMIESLIEASKFQVDKCEPSKFPKLWQKNFHVFVQEYSNWCREEQINVCLKYVFEPKFEAAEMELKPEHKSALIKATELAFLKGSGSFAAIDRSRLYQKETDENKLTQALLNFMENHLASPQSYTKDSRKFKLELRNSFGRICKEEIKDFNKVNKELFDLLNEHDYKHVSTMINQQTINLIGASRVCRQYLAEPEKYEELVSKEFNTKYPIVKRTTKKILNKITFSSNCAGSSNQMNNKVCR